MRIPTTSLRPMRSTRLSVAAILLFAVASAVAAEAVPEAVLKLEPYRKTVAFRAKVAGQDGLFGFDTGAGTTLLTPDFAKKAGCEPWGRLTGFNMMATRIDSQRCDGLSLDIQGYSVKKPTTAVFDLMSLFPKDATPIQGLIGLDLFDGKAVTIDFPGSRVIVESPGSLRQRVRTARELQMRIGREVQGLALAVYVGVPSASGTLWMELDSGNGGTVLVSKPYAKLFALDPEAKGPQKLSLELAPGLHVDTDHAFTPKMIMDGNLGMPFLKDKVVTLDLAQGRMWIAAAPAPSSKP